MFTVLLCLFVILAIELPFLLRLQQRRELLAFAFFFALAAVMSIAMSLGYRLPSAMLLAERFMTNVLHLTY